VQANLALCVTEANTFGTTSPASAPATSSSWSVSTRSADVTRTTLLCRTGFWAFLAVAICGLAPAGSLGAEQSCLHRRPEELRLSLHERLMLHPGPGWTYVLAIQNGGPDCSLLGVPYPDFRDGSVRPKPQVHNVGRVMAIDLHHGGKAYFSFSFESRARCPGGSVYATDVTFVSLGDLVLERGRRMPVCQPVEVWAYRTDAAQPRHRA
jgi:hypothetical protein